MLGSFFSSKTTTSLNSSLNKSYYSIFLILLIIVSFISCFFIPVINSQGVIYYDLNIIENMEISQHGFLWPAPGYTKINSPYGKRVSPTAGASNFHKGIDIGAPEGAKFIAVVDGIITFTGFLGGGGYTITLSRDNMKISYCHVSPNYIVKEGQYVMQGQVIGFVGPKNVYGVIGNQYKDSNGNPTNGATTGPHLHLGIRVDGEYVNPLNYY